MNKFSFIKYTASFVIALALGFGATELFNKFYAQNSQFSAQEAVSHLNKEVQELCNAKFVTVEQTKGTTVSVKDFRGVYSVAVDWDYSFRGRRERIWYDKNVYEKCIVETGETEQ